MIPRGVAKRYARALLDAALKSGIEADVCREAEALRELLRDNQPLREFLLSPQSPPRDKKRVIESALSNRASRLLIEFLLLLIDKKRLALIEEMIEAYVRLYEQHQGVLEVKAVTAVPLDLAMQRKILEKLTRETGRQVRLVTEIDPDIIGGMVLVMGDKIIDGGIKHQMEMLRRDLDAIRV